MSCSLCGDVCRCVSGLPAAEESGLDLAARDSAADPAGATSTVEGTFDTQLLVSSLQSLAHPPTSSRGGEGSAFANNQRPTTNDALPAGDWGLAAGDSRDESWRKEVSDRLNRYHARRRPRPPRYPSLSLKFDAPETRWSATARDASSPSVAHAVQQASPVMQQAVAVQYAPPASEVKPVPDQLPEESRPTQHRARRESSGKLIEFPRTMYTPPPSFSDLAEPIIDRPRILEAPELLPPPPALGGLTIEEADRPAPERRLGIDMPLQSASVRQRMLAAAIDAALILTGMALFGAICYRLSVATLALKPMAILVAGLLIFFWTVYQYLLIVHSGTTVGLRALHLHLRRFDGSPAPRKLRRNRTLCALLSTLSLGLGYAWYFLDEDGLCWHERVTKTHISSQPKE
jgi:hypothetical protein